MPSSSRANLSVDLASLLEYLDAVGYGELYVPRPEPRAPARKTIAGTAPAGRRGSTRTTDRSAPSRPEDVHTVSPMSAAPPPAIDPAAATPTAWDDRTDLPALAEVALACTRCGLAAGRKSVVFGTGNPDADLMFVGEGPGAEEDRQGLPFVGPAGELLDKIVEAIGLTRGEVYIANVVKCRPPGNRDPLPDEVAACRGFLERQIDLVRPRVIVCLGRVAAQTLLAAEMPLSRLRGRWHSVRGVPTRATYHPAALLRNPGWKRPTWEDMQQVRDRLAGP